MIPPQTSSSNLYPFLFEPVFWLGLSLSCFSLCYRVFFSGFFFPWGLWATGPLNFPFRFHFGPQLLCCYVAFVAVVASLVACYSLLSFLLVVVLSLFDDGCGNAQQVLLHTVKFVQYVPACSGSSANRWNESHCAIHKW